MKAKYLRIFVNFFFLVVVCTLSISLLKGQCHNKVWFFPFNMLIKPRRTTNWAVGNCTFFRFSDDKQCFGLHVVRVMLHRACHFGVRH